MAKYSKTTLATIAALQKRSRAPIIVTEKALVSHLYPFKYNEESDIFYDRAIDKNLNLSSPDKDASTLGFTFNIVKFSSVYKLNQSDNYDTDTKVSLTINKVSERIVDLGTSNEDIYSTDSKVSISLNKVTLNFVEQEHEDVYSTDTVVSIGINKVTI